MLPTPAPQAVEPGELVMRSHHRSSPPCCLLCLVAGVLAPGVHGTVPTTHGIVGQRICRFTCSSTCSSTAHPLSLTQIVSYMLRTCVYDPLMEGRLVHRPGAPVAAFSRTRRMLGVLASFAASGLLHEMLYW